MRKVIGKILAGATVLSVLIAGNAFATPVNVNEVTEIFSDAFSFTFSAADQKVLADNFDTLITTTNRDTKLTALSNILGVVNEYADSGVDSVAEVSVVENGDDTTPGNGAAPVPEPATMLLFGAGLVGLVGAVRRKAQK